MIAQQCDGISPPYEAFYIHSIIYAADRAEDAFQRFDSAVGSSGSPELIVATVQEALTHAAAISRFFWPMGRTDLAKARGRKLRDAFAVEDTSPLRHRKLRNAFEHFDEDLDSFLLEDRVGYFFPSPLVDDHSLADDQLGNIFKLVDPASGICVLLGEKYEFGRIRAEVWRILTAAHAMDNAGSRLPRAQSKEDA
jgi:hypothetical protein